ncbi:MAG: TIR domain-containing protein [Clostridia bacterium]|nr:TIR domain-containing protein [Clostridia bacterium]
MAIFKCKMCGGDLDVSELDTVFECEYCGTNQTIPSSRDEEITNLFNRAELLRKNCEFDKAERMYEKILEINSREAEAYWGVILCRYGVEYVDDPKTGKKIPTCHRTSYEAVTADEHYKASLENADVVQRAIYQREAEQIDKIQKGILELSYKEAPYDVFICYKQSDETGKRTKDSVLANEIYHELTSEGFRVFYSAISLEDKLGEEYEPYIFSALNSARVMLVVGTRAEYFNAVWVKNEWSRFLKLIKKDRTKRLIPCYRDMDAYDLPEEFAHLQAQDMSKLGFISDIVRGIKKLIPKTTEKEEAKTYSSPKYESGEDSSISNNLKRAYLVLEEGDFTAAELYAEMCLGEDVECAEAYLIKLMAYCEVKNKGELCHTDIRFTENTNYKRAVRFGSEELSRELTFICNERDYNQARQLCLDATSENDYLMAKRYLQTLNGYKDSFALIKMCDDKIRNINTLELKEEVDKRLYATNLSPAAEAACLMYEQEKKVERYDLKIDNNRISQSVPILVMGVITVILFIVTACTDSWVAPLLLLCAAIVTLVLFFTYLKKYFPKSIILYAILTVATVGWLACAIPFIMWYDIYKVQKMKKELKEEQEKLTLLTRSFNEAILDIEDENVRERIRTLSYNGHQATEIARIISEEEIDYI